MRSSSGLLVLLVACLVVATAGQGFKPSEQPVGVSSNYDQQQRQYVNGRKWQKTYNLNPKAACNSANSRSLCASAVTSSVNSYAELMFATSPAVYSSTDSKYTSSVRLVATPLDQGDCETCSAFAVAAAAETAMAAALQIDVQSCSISVQALHFCPPDNQPGRSCFGGYTIDSTISVLQKWSASLPTQDCLPYKPDFKGEMLDSDMCGRSCSTSSQYASHGSFSSNRITTLWEAQRHIRLHGSVVTRFDWLSDLQPFFSNPANAKAVYKPKPGAKFVAGHAVVLVGYDNDKQFWLAKNSWGNSWADGGFFRVAYGTCSILEGASAEVYGVRWNPREIAEAVKLRVTNGPKSKCYLYKAKPTDYPSLVAASAGIPLDKFLADNTANIPNLGAALQGKELLLCNPQPGRIINANAPSTKSSSTSTAPSISTGQSDIQDVHKREMEALLRFKALIDPNNVLKWTRESGANGGYCRWPGVDNFCLDVAPCEKGGMSCQLGLGNFNKTTKLQGRVPDVLIELKSLRQLRLQYNELTGTLPDFIGQMSLQVLELEGNKFTGTIPSSWRSGPLSKTLRVIDLSGNKLTGTLPEWLADFPHMTQMNFAYNDFKGTVPKSWSSWLVTGEDVAYKALITTGNPRLVS